ncbi:acyl-CoA thioesterase [Brumicola nitratireducens]|uniref:Thioesterase superfamily protein n=1 Tax=Glaciecola nitratireducens (strain JCM 12485 / KCTC 12276 / FR1064) TaxID=1085623 RepID=G4QFD6_GLANF|nr:thioesterase family protein [Glaciecola nitratireducens]AEP28480.1 thioesterase superfamily protein [Glaciecola nitratireducens FR1064]
MLSIEFDVRFYETDALQHVSNTVLVGWFETARLPIFKYFTPDLDLNNWPLILANYNVDFLEQIYLAGPVEVKTWVSRIGNSSFVVYQELWQSNTKKAKGTTTLVRFDYASKKSVRIPDDIRAKLEEHKIELE